MKAASIFGILAICFTVSAQASDGNKFSLVQTNSFSAKSVFPKFERTGNWEGAERYSTLSANKEKTMFTSAFSIFTIGSKIALFNADGSAKWIFPENNAEALHINRAVIGTKYVAASSSFGKVYFLDIETGQLAKEIQLSDPDGEEVKYNNAGPFGELGIMNDQKTFILPSNSGKVFFVDEESNISSIKVDCLNEDKKENSRCFFWQPIVTRNDGVMAALVGHGTLLFQRDGRTVERIQSSWHAFPRLSEDGNSIVLTSKYVDERTGKIAQDIISIPSKGARKVISIKEENVDVNFVNQNKNGDIAFTAKIRDENARLDIPAIGIIQSGQQNPTYAKMPPKVSELLMSTLYSAPSFDDIGRIYASDLEGRLLVTDRNGNLLAVKSLNGEVRNEPLIMADGTIIVPVLGTLYNGLGGLYGFKSKEY